MAGLRLHGVGLEITASVTMDHRGSMNGDDSVGVQLPERIHGPVGFAGVLEDHCGVTVHNDSYLWALADSAERFAAAT